MPSTLKGAGAGALKLGDKQGVYLQIAAGDGFRQAERQEESWGDRSGELRET